MKVSLQWLKDYVDIDISVEELAEKLTRSGTSVEEIIDEGKQFDHVVAGRLVRVTYHPNSDHLKICQVDVGKKILQIITGAPNITEESEGKIVPVAMVGAKLPNGQTISKGKMRGEVSEGMLCSEDELALSDNHEGIMILSDDIQPGTPAREIFDCDVVFDFELTANRADCFSVIGIAREISVLLKKDLKLPETECKPSTQGLCQIQIQDKDLCSRFSARVFENVRIAPSPVWMQKRLKAAGMRAINNIVDVTNFVMLEMGQPLHAYDYEKIAGRTLIARRALAGEQLHTLDDSSRLAQGGELVIADVNNPAGLAGVMGGFETEITDDTKTMLLEAANFAPASIRKTSRKFNLLSEAANRFTHGVDIELTTKALDRAAYLLQEMDAVSGYSEIVDVYPEKIQPKEISFTIEKLNDFLGTKYSEEKVFGILEKLGFEILPDGETASEKKFKAIVPSWRRTDVFAWQDLSEEVARIDGYDLIQDTTPMATISLGAQSAKQTFCDKIQDCLCSLGLNETLSLAFMNEQDLDKLQIPNESVLRKAIPILNPLANQEPFVRTTLIPHLFKNLLYNLSHKNEDVRLFEMAPVFFPKELPLQDLPEEKIMLAGVLTGHRLPLHWANKGDLIDFYDVKGILETLFEQLGVKRYTIEAGEHVSCHPAQTAIFKKGKDVFGFLGKVHPTVLKNFDIETKKDVFLFELDVMTLLKNAQSKNQYQRLPKFPSIQRDIAVVVDSTIEQSQLERVIKRSAGGYFKSVVLFDVYTGKPIPEGKKSLAYSIQFQSSDKTLLDEEIDADFEKIVEALTKEFDAELRS